MNVFLFKAKRPAKRPKTETETETEADNQIIINYRIIIIYHFLLRCFLVPPRDRDRDRDHNRLIFGKQSVIDGSISAYLGIGSSFSSTNPSGSKGATGTETIRLFFVI